MPEDKASVLRKKCPPHLDDGMRCLVSHYDAGNLLPPCFKCGLCRHWIAWNGIDKSCLGCEEIRMYPTCAFCEKPWHSVFSDWSTGEVVKVRLCDSDKCIQRYRAEAEMTEKDVRRP